MFSLAEVARMPNSSILTNVLHGGPAPRSSVDLHSIPSNGEQSREYNDSAYEERVSAFNSGFDGNEVSTDPINNDNNGIQRQRHETRSLALPTAIPDLFCSVTDDKTPRNGHQLRIKINSNTESHSLGIKTGDNTLGGSIPQAFNPLHNPGSADKVNYMCMTQMQDCYELCIGTGPRITRWVHGSEICYIICTESFEALGATASVTAAMRDAISMWGKIAGVSFKEVGRREPATFRVKLKRGHDDSGLYATSFFPRTRAGSLYIYQEALENASSYLANILAHELGHILGLRHEFALKKEGFLPSVRFGKENPQSIMDYPDHLSQLQVGEQDREELAAFYAYRQADYLGLPIVEVTPPLKDNW